MLGLEQSEAGDRNNMSLLIPDNIGVTSGGGHPYPGVPVFCDFQHHCRDDIDSSIKLMGSEREGLAVASP